MASEVPFFDLGVAARMRRSELHEALDNVLDTGQFIGGDRVVAFERDFARYLDVRTCVAVGNGLDALRIGMESLGIGPGDEVIVPAFTFYATWLAVLQLGAVPVPVDVRLDTGGIDVRAVESALGPRTRAVIVVHLFGIPVEMSHLRSLTASRGIAVIEDAAQSHGARTASGRFTGTVGDIGAFSFYPTKNLGAFGDAGAIVTNQDDLAVVARRRRSYGQGRSKYDHVDTGWNSRLDSLQAAFLERALPRLEAANQRRRTIAEVYLEVLGDRRVSVVGQAYSSRSVWHHFVVRAVDRLWLREHFESRGIGTDVHYPYWFGSLKPLARYGPVSAAAHASRLAEEVVSLPIAPWLSEGDVERVAGVLSLLPSSALAE